MTSIILSSLLFISIAANVFLFFVFRGATKEDEETIETYKRQKLSGVDVETIRRTILAYGRKGISVHDVMDLIYTIRSIQLGQYTDTNPYMPANPYDGFDTIDDFESEINIKT